MQSYKLIHGDCYEKLKDLEDNSIDTVITDPPYGLGEVKDLAGLLQDWIATGWHDEDKVGAKGFMSKSWDNSVPPPAIWKEVYRVLKPGGTALVFAGTRTFDLMAFSMKLAGFIHKDTLMWLHSQGFPKALDISKAIDQKLGMERKVIEEITTKSGGMANVNKVNVEQGHRPNNYNEHGNVYQITEATSDEAKMWEGFKSHSIKPAYEPILIMMKSNEGSYTDNALKWEVSGLNIDGGRVPSSEEDKKIMDNKSSKNPTTNYSDKPDKIYSAYAEDRCSPSNPIGRFPANVIHDGSDEVMEEFNKYGKTKSGATKKDVDAYDGESNTAFLRGNSNPQNQHGDSGSIARFFYCAKASKADRTCNGEVENKHPTVKNRNLMAYLARLTKTPTGGIVLDPFMGSGSTLIGCIMEDRPAIGIERDKESFDTAQARVDTALEQSLFRKSECSTFVEIDGKNEQDCIAKVHNCIAKVHKFEELDMFE